MLTVRELHDQAMAIAQDIDVKRQQGEDVAEDAARAFELERAAAQLVPPGNGSERTRSILYRSAAWLAIEAGRYDDAIACARAGLSSAFSTELRQELVEVLSAALVAQRDHEKKEEE